MSLIGTTNEEKIWNYFIAKGLNNFGCAGLMGNLYAESALNPINLQQTFEKKLGYKDKTYTEAIDNGSYTNFVRDFAGYGLAQWTYWSRKQNLLNYAKLCSKSIGDLEMQLDFLWKELCESYKSVLSALQSANSVLVASNVVLFQFERPANQSESVQKQRSKYGQAFYDKFVKEETDMTEAKKDNIPDLWAKEAVDWAVKNKILFGDDRGDYKLHDNCTRQEMLVFLYRLYNLVK